MAAANVSRDGTGEGLVEFFEYLGERGLMNKATAGARKTAATKVLGIDEGWEDTDLRALDLDEQVERFMRLEKQNYKPNSLAVYASRFKSAVEEYLNYLANPSSFKAPSSSTGNGDKANARGASKASTTTSQTPLQASEDVRGTGGTESPAPPATQSPQHKLITYPFPLRGSGTMAYLQLPPDLRADEASRLAKFLESLAIPDQDK